jgi:hypothetical protein
MLAYIHTYLKWSWSSIILKMELELHHPYIANLIYLTITWLINNVIPDKIVFHIHLNLDSTPDIIFCDFIPKCSGTFTGLPINNGAPQLHHHWFL